MTKSVERLNPDELRAQRWEHGRVLNCNPSEIGTPGYCDVIADAHVCGLLDLFELQTHDSLFDEAYLLAFPPFQPKRKRHVKTGPY